MINILALIPLIVAPIASDTELTPRRIIPKRPLSSFELPSSISFKDIQLVVKFRDSLKIRCNGTGKLQVTGVGLLDPEISALAVTFRPWLETDPEKLQDLQNRASAHSRRTQPDLAGFMVAEPEDATLEALSKYAKALQVLKCVEYVEFLAAAPTLTSVKPPSTQGPPGDLSGDQGWRLADGLDFDSANSRGALGAGVRYTDVQGGWFTDHDDLKGSSGLSVVEHEPNRTMVPLPPVLWRMVDHGTATIGIAAAQHNGFGMDGGAPEGTFFVYQTYNSSPPHRHATAVCNAIADSDFGDIVNLSIAEYSISAHSGIPWEYPQCNWDIIRTGSDAGVIICGSAGNTGSDLDHGDFDIYDFGDSGAIVVGSGEPTAAHNWAGTNHGSRVHVHAWGDGVATLGYGDLHPATQTSGQPVAGYVDAYTDTYSGTSSASPLVSAGALALQSYAIAQGRAPLDGREMRLLLKSTGELPATSTQIIGEQPDLDAALDLLDRSFHRNYCNATTNVSGEVGVIGSTGTSKIANDDLVLNASFCNPNELGFFIYGPDRGYSHIGTGYLCIGAYWTFAFASTDASGSASAAFPQSPAGSPYTVLSGSLYNFQFLYRDGGLLNATDALEVVFF